MKIFLSWSGDHARCVASALLDLLKQLDIGLDPWISSLGIATGQDWRDELSNQLRSAQAGIICVSRYGLKSDWVHFEVGAMSVALPYGSIFPYLIDIEQAELPPTLKSIQSAQATEEGTWKLVSDIYSKISTNQLDPGLKVAFSKKWSALEAAINHPGSGVLRPLNSDDYNRLDYHGFVSLLHIHFSACARRIQRTVSKALADVDGKVEDIDYDILAMDMTTTLREARALLSPFHYFQEDSISDFMESILPESELKAQLTEGMDFGKRCKTQSQFMNMIETMISREQTKLMEVINSRLHERGKAALRT